MEESCWDRAEKKFIGDKELKEHVEWVIHVDPETFSEEADGGNSSS